MKSIKYLLPLVTLSWSHNSYGIESVRSDPDRFSYSKQPDLAVTKDDLDDMEDRLLRVIRNSNNRRSSGSSRKRSRVIYVVGDRPGLSGSRYSGGSHTSHGKSDRIDIIIKGPPSTSQNGDSCYPTCPSYHSHAYQEHTACYPHCGHAPAPTAWSYYQPPHAHNTGHVDPNYSSHTSSALASGSHVPVATSVENHSYVSRESRGNSHAPSRSVTRRSKQRSHWRPKSAAPQIADASGIVEPIHAVPVPPTVTAE